MPDTTKYYKPRKNGKIFNLKKFLLFNLKFMISHLNQYIIDDM